MARQKRGIVKGNRPNAAKPADGFPVGSFDYSETLASVADIAVSTLADFCFIDMLDEGGAPRRVATAHRNPAMEALSRKFSRRYPPSLVRNLRAKFLRGHSRLAVLVPVRGRGRPLGAITLLRERAGTPFTRKELAAAEGLAHRAALTIENALLYRQARKELDERRRAEAELKKNHTLLRAIVEGSTDGIFVKDVEGRYLLANPSLSRIVGIPGENLSGWKDVDALPPGSAPQVKSDDARVIDEGKARLFEYSWTIDGVPRTHQTLRAPYLDEAGNVIGIIGITRDITSQKQLAERLGFLAEASRQLAESLDSRETLECVARLATSNLADWCLIDMMNADQTLRREITTHRDPARAEWVRDCLRRYPPQPDRDGAALDAVKRGVSHLYTKIPPALYARYAQDSEHLRILKELKLHSMMVVPMRAGRSHILGAITFLSAESRRVYGPEDLAMAEDLAHRAALAIESATLLREAQEAVRAREEFLAIASHELKTPLTALELHLENLMRLARRNEGGVPPPEPLKKSLDAVARQGDRLTRLINGLLDMTRIRAGRLVLDREELDLSALTRTIVDRFADELARSRSTLTLRADRPVVGWWDRPRLEQVVANLYANALKYGDGGPIEVSVQAHDGVACLTLRDHGGGISRQDLERLFSPFARASSPRHFGGLGLGLYLSRQIVEAHGGFVLATSKEGDGSTFTVQLPRNSESAPPAS